MGLYDYTGGVGQSFLDKTKKNMSGNFLGDLFSSVKSGAPSQSAGNTSPTAPNYNPRVANRDYYGFPDPYKTTDSAPSGTVPNVPSNYFELADWLWPNKEGEPSKSSSYSPWASYSQGIDNNMGQMALDVDPSAHSEGDRRWVNPFINAKAGIDPNKRAWFFNMLQDAERQAGDITGKERESYVSREDKIKDWKSSVKDYDRDIKHWHNAKLRYMQSDETKAKLKEYDPRRGTHGSQREKVKDALEYEWEKNNPRPEKPGGGEEPNFSTDPFKPTSMYDVIGKQKWELPEWARTAIDDYRKFRDYPNNRWALPFMKGHVVGEYPDLPPKSYPGPDPPPPPNPMPKPDPRKILSSYYGG